MKKLTSKKNKKNKSIFFKCSEESSFQFISIWSALIKQLISMRFDPDITTDFVYSMITPLILLFSSIIFGLLWIVFQYNFLYVMIFESNMKNFFYSTALNQLFIDMYVMEFYIVGLFLLMRNSHHQFVCVNQAVIMIIIMTMTVLFQFVLNESFGFCFQFLFDADLRDKFESKNHEAMSDDHNWILRRLFFLFLAEFKTSDTWEKTFVTENSTKFSNYNFNIFSHVFQHGSFWFPNPMMWIPNDLLEISIDEIFWTKQHYTNVKIFNKHANFNEKKKLTIVQNFNKFFEIKSMKFWLLKFQISHVVQKVQWMLCKQFIVNLQQMMKLITTVWLQKLHLAPSCFL